MPLNFYPGTNCPEYPFLEMSAYQTLEVFMSMYVASKSGVMKLEEGGEEDLLRCIREQLLALPAITGRGNMLSERVVAAK